MYFQLADFIILPDLNVSILLATTKNEPRMEFYSSLTQLARTRSLISLFLVACVAHVIYTVAKRCIEYRVSVLHIQGV